MLHTDPMPIVGWVGAGNTIRVVATAERVICRPTVAHTVFVFVLTAIFGPALSGSLVATALINSASALPPWPIMGCVVFMNLVTWIFFVQVLLVQPRIEIAANSGDVLVFRRRRGLPALRLPHQTIVHVDTRVFDFVDLGKSGAEVVPKGQSITREHLARRRVANYVLTVHTTTGSRYDLCVSPDEALIHMLKRTLGK